MPESLQFHHEQEKGFLVAALGATTKWPETGQYLTTTLLVRRIGETLSNTELLPDTEHHQIQGCPPPLNKPFPRNNNNVPYLTLQKDIYQ